MHLSQSAIESLPRVDASLRYVVPMTGKPSLYEYEPPPGVAHTTATFEERTVAIRNIRSVAADMSLERQGFRLATAPSAMRDFHDEEEIRRTYYPETERLVAEMTGAARVVTFDHTIRRRIAGVPDRAPGAQRQPVHRVHNDYTVKSGPQRVRDLLGDDADGPLRRRFSVINVWRPIRGPLQDAPLAVSDARTVAFDDLVAADLLYRERTGEYYMVKFNPSHRWFYAPGMREDEVLAIKCFDSAEDGRARFTPHAAFEDPTAPQDVLPRESIELRTLAFFAG